MTIARSTSCLRVRLVKSGITAIVVGVFLSAALDRTLVFAGLWAPMRFALTTAVLLVVLIAPLLYSLDRWVVRPLETLRTMQRDQRADRPVTVPFSTGGPLPDELRETLQQHATILNTLQRTNQRLHKEVRRRTSGLSALAASASAVVSATDERLGPRVLDALKNVAVDAHPVVILPEGNAYVVHVAATSNTSPSERRALETQLLDQLAKNRPLTVRWSDMGQQSGDPILRLRLLFRAPIQDDQGLAAVCLFTSAPANLSLPSGSVRHILTTLASQLHCRLGRSASSISPDVRAIS